MVNAEDIAAQADRMRAAIGKAYGFKVGSLKRAAARAGRRLPRRVQAAIAPVLEAEAFGGHPKLVRRINPATLRAAEATLTEHLKTVDRAAMRRNAGLNWLTNLVVYVLIVFSGFAAWLYVTGHFPA